MAGSGQEHNTPHQTPGAAPRAESKACPQCAQPVGTAPPDAPAVRFCPYCMLPLIEVAGKYRIEAKLDEGGGGAVFLARHLYLKLHPMRVVKFLHNEQLQSPTGLKRFAREIEMTAVLSQNNQHIVRVYDDFGHVPKLGYFYVMELLEGVTLKELIATHPNGLPPRDAVHIFRQLCRAVQTIHQAQIIHRDLKPHNIYLIQRNEDPYFVKVMDFGIARMMGSPGITHTKESSIGTPQYMSPEQCMGLPADERSDVYAMGLLLYELLVGRTPFFAVTENSTTSLMELVSAHLYHEPAPFRVANPTLTLSPALEAAVMKAIAKPREERFQTARDFLQAVNTAFDQPAPRQHNAPMPLAASHPSDEQAAIRPGHPHPPPQLPTAESPPGPPVPSPLGSVRHLTMQTEPGQRSRQPRSHLSMGAIKGIMALGTFVALVSLFVAWRTQQAHTPQTSPAPPRPDLTTSPRLPPRPRLRARAVPLPPDTRRKHPPLSPRMRRRPQPRRTLPRRRLRRRVLPTRPRTAGCPPDPKGGRWLRLLLHPKQARVVTKSRVEYRLRGLCVLQQRNSPTRLRITHYDFQPCSVERRFKRRVLSIRLKQNQLDIDDRFDYCIP